jgi:exodeoxyribonuclease V alpha subunit
MIKVNGCFSKEIFKNNHFSIFTFKVEESSDNSIKENSSIKIRVNDNIHLSSGQELAITCYADKSSKYGDQYISKSIILEESSKKTNNLHLLNTFNNKERHLVKGLIENLGDKAFTDTQTLQNAIDALEVSGHSKNALKRTFRKTSSLFNDAQFVFSGSHNKTKINTINKLLDKYGAELFIKIINNNPYILVSVEGVTFHRIDEIVQRASLQVNKSARAKAFIDYVLVEEEKRGHTCVPLSRFQKLAEAQLNVSADEINRILESYSANQYLHIESHINSGKIVTSNQSMKNGLNIIKHLSRLTNGKSSFNHSNPLAPHDNLNEGQENAVRKLIKTKVGILTGGPGTGKTHTLRTLVSDLKTLKKDAKFVLCAPTGKAASRMEASTGIKASTIHSALGCADGVNFERNANNPIDADVVLVDESSMIGEQMASRLLDAIPDHAKIIFIGDQEQLPAVEGGNFMSDLILSKRIPTANLTEVMRQKSKDGRMSDIITVSKQIMDKENNKNIRLQDLKNNEVVWIGSQKSDKNFKEKAEITNNTIGRAIDRLLSMPNVTADDIQILTPRKATLSGVDSLNQLLRYKLNPGSQDSKHQIERFGKVFNPNDRVIFTRNNNKLGVSNGDVGTIKFINKMTNKVKIQLQRNTNNEAIEINTSDLDILDIAYAKTVHKSQGSEYPYVIMTIAEEHQGMLNPSSIYTGMTRATKKCIMIGEPQAFFQSFKNDKQFERSTNLATMISKELSNREATPNI